MFPKLAGWFKHSRKRSIQWKEPFLNGQWNPLSYSIATLHPMISSELTTVSPQHMPYTNFSLQFKKLMLICWFQIVEQKIKLTILFHVPYQLFGMWRCELIIFPGIWPHWILDSATSPVFALVHIRILTYNILWSLTSKHNAYFNEHLLSQNVDSFKSSWDCWCYPF